MRLLASVRLRLRLSEQQLERPLRLLLGTGKPLLLGYLRTDLVGKLQLLMRALCHTLAGLVALLPASIQAVEVTFRLVPMAEVRAAGPADGLPDGTVFLYRTGSYRPEIVLPVNEPGSLPVGTWHWVAEAPGWVSVDSGTLVVGEERAARRTMIWPVVPACRLDLVDDWRGVERLDVASPTFGSVHPLRPGRRPGLNAPAGEPTIAYTVGSRGLIGIRRVDGCHPGAVLPLEPPRPPPPEQQDVLVHVLLPEGVGREELLVRFTSAGGAREPVAAVWRGRRGSFFLLGLPASQASELRVTHPRLRSVTVPVEPLGGSARELTPVEMVARRGLSLDVDYRPLQQRPASLQARHCAGGVPVRQSLDACPLIAEQPLAPGRHRYRFDHLDDGLYVLSARIGDEVVHGLGAGAFVALEPGVADEPPVGDYVLAEQEIHGAILDGGRPVLGEVRLLPVDEGWPLRRARTGSDGLYRLFYFGHRPFGRFRLPGDDERSEQETAGLHFFYRLAACDDAGRCRDYHPDSVLRGSGRLDLEIGTGGGVAVEVTDASSGEPLEGAVVRMPGPAQRLVFDGGRVEWLPATGDATVRRTTDASGRAAFAVVEPGRVPVEASHPGFRTGGAWVELTSGSWAEVGVALAPDPSGPGGTRFELLDGRPLSGGAVLAYGEGGRLLPCRLQTGDAGRLPPLPPPCRAARWLVLVHPEAALVPVEASRALGPRLELPSAPWPPLRLQVLDAAGAPVPGVPVELVFRNLVLDEAAWMLALSVSGGDLLIRRTDSSGTVLLRSVDPHASDGPALRLGIEDAEPEPLAGLRPGDTVTVRLDDDR